MKKLFSMVLLLMASATLLSFVGCSNTASNNTSQAPTPTPEPTPDVAAIRTELTRIENDWPRIIKERDVATLRKNEADDIMIIYPDGSVGNKEQDVKDIEAGLLSFDSWEVNEVKVNVLDKDSAMVTIRYTITNAKLKQANGRVTDISGQYISLDTFARRNGQWQFVGLSSAKVLNPVTTPTPAPTPKASASVAAPPRPSPTTRVSPAPRVSPAVTRPATPRPTPARPTATP